MCAGKITITKGKTEATKVMIVCCSLVVAPLRTGTSISESSAAGVLEGSLQEEAELVSFSIGQLRPKLSTIKLRNHQTSVGSRLSCSNGPQTNQPIGCVGYLGTPGKQVETQRNGIPVWSPWSSNMATSSNLNGIVHLSCYRQSQKSWKTWLMVLCTTFLRTGTFTVHSWSLEETDRAKQTARRF